MRGQRSAEPAHESGAETVGRTRASRRDFVRALGVAGIGLGGLAGCQIDMSKYPSGTRRSGIDKGALKLSDSGARLPRKRTTIRWMSGGPGGKSAYFHALLPAYHKRHPQLRIAYDELPNEKIAEVLPLQLRSGKAADLFAAIGAPLAPLVRAGQVVALDDIVPDFQAWKNDIPFGVLVPGSQQFNGKTYALPASSAKLTGTLLLYNREHLRRAGQEPGDQPWTYEEFRAVARKVTRQGDGSYYGFMTGNTTFSSIVTDLAQLAGGPAPLDWSTGEYAYHAEEYVAAIEFLLALKADGSLLPGTVGLPDQQARARMAQGAAGMIFNGAWNFSVWRDQNPGFDFGVSRQPLPVKGAPSTIAYEAGGVNGYSVYSGAGEPQQAVAGDLLHFLGSRAGQRAWAALVGASDPAWHPEAIRHAQSTGALDEKNRTAFAIYDEVMRLGPSPALRNPEAAEVFLSLAPVAPDLTLTVQGLLTGQLDQPEKALRDLSHRSEAALEKAIAAAREKGAEVSRDDWKFSNWNPAEDYLRQKYDELG